MNLEHIALNLLVFVFGYFTCRTFYFFKSARRSIALLKFSQIVALSIFLKCIEEYTSATTHKLMALNKCGILESDPVYKKISLESNLHIEDFKKRSVASIVALHAGFFEPTVDFSDWATAMTFLKNNRKVMETFFKNRD
tara:strand:+ start:48288 stop:48704 length:417 start_codon:yes stop_codon:yes gene_type:complete